MTRSIYLYGQCTLLIGLAVCTCACSRPSPIAKPVLTEPTVASQVITETPSDSQFDPFLEQRLHMVEQTIITRGVEDERVLDAMRTVPRHEFVLENFIRQAYDDHPLPIGHGQTISQPYIVAWMTELLQLQVGDRVLEIGTGSGYQAAVLYAVGGVEVYTIEIVPELAEQAAECLSRLAYDVQVKEANGYYGWEEHAPYDAIIVTAAPDHLPQPLVQQLVEGGILVIPIGPPGGYQSLWQFTRTGDTVQARNMGGVMFVPFTGGGVGGLPEDAP